MLERGARHRRPTAAAAVGLASLSLVAACAMRPAPPRTNEVGIASWYGPGFHGRPTASGERYDQNALTAAHPTLPLGTWARVTNLANGRQVVVRINDRGPFVRGRRIDLSRAAARRLGMLGAGTAAVRIEPLLEAGGPRAAVAFAVQVASFAERSRAEAAREKLGRSPALARRLFRRAPSRVYLRPARLGGRRIYRVRVGPYPARREAEALARRLAAAGLQPIVVEEVVRR